MDPFESLRGTEPPSEEESYMLTEEHAKNAYRLCAHDSDLESAISQAKEVFMGNGMTEGDAEKEARREVWLEREFSHVWEPILVRALVENEEFRRAVLDDHHVPRTYDFSRMRAHKTWLITIYLPGFWQFYNSASAGIRDIEENGSWAHIVEEAKSLVVETIADKVARDLEVHQRNQLGNSVPTSPSDPSLATAAVFSLAQAEKRTNHVRGDAKRVMLDLESHLQSFSAGQELMGLYGLVSSASMPTASSLPSHTIIDEFGDKALPMLKTSSGLKDFSNYVLSPLDTDQALDRHITQMAAFAESLEDEAAEDDELAVTVGTYNDRSDIVAVGQEFEKEYEPVPEEKLLADAISIMMAGERKYKPIILYPWTGATSTPFFFISGSDNDLAGLEVLEDIPKATSSTAEYKESGTGKRSSDSSLCLRRMLIMYSLSCRQALF